MACALTLLHDTAPDNAFLIGRSSTASRAETSARLAARALPIARARTRALAAPQAKPAKNKPPIQDNAISTQRTAKRMESHKRDPMAVSCLLYTSPSPRD